MKHKIQGFVIWEKSPHRDAPRIRFSEIDTARYRKNDQSCLAWANEVTVGPCEIEVEVPDDFDPRGPMIESLRERKQYIIATMIAQATVIDYEIGKLLVFDHKVAV